MKNIYGSAWCLILVSSLSIVACSPPDEDKTATSEQKPAIQKLDFGRAPLPTELEPLKKLADAGDAKAAHSLAGWYLNQDYEFFDPQKAYELGYIIEKFEPSDGLNIRANAIGKGATPKHDESEESLRKKAEAFPSKKVKFNILEAETRHLLLGRQRTLAKEKTIKMASKTGSQALANIANHWPTISNKEAQDAVVKVITALRNEAETGDIEATGRLAYWLGVMLPAFGFSEKEVMSLPLTPKLLASHASTYAHKAADAGDVRGIVTLIWLARNSETTLAELRAKVSQLNSPESTSFIADLIDNWGPDFYIVREIFPEVKEDDVLALKRTWLRKAARAGNLDSYGQLAATYLAPTNYCDLRFGRTKTEREFEQKQRCEVDFKSDGAGVQDDLRDGVRVGNVYALMMSGALFLDGNGVAQDFETGLDYLKRSARIGNPYAFALLTRLYFDGGKGLSKSAENAYLYANLMKSFQGGYITTAIDYAEQQRLNGLILNAQKMLSTLEASLPPDIVSEAQQITRAWKRGAPIPAMAEAEASDSPRGTGFFIDDKGGMITAAHVVTSCKRVKLVDIGKIGEVLAKDKANDIALVRFEQTPGSYARIRAEAPKVGEPVFVYGFPLGGAIAANGSITAGVVSALTGLENDSNRVQVSAPVQQGNSGGPLFDNHGSVVGMVDSKLNVLRIGKVTGDLPQNVNFAIKNSSLSSFLDVQNTKYSRPSWLSSLFAKDGEAVAEVGRSVTYKVACAGK